MGGGHLRLTTLCVLPDARQDARCAPRSATRIAVLPIDTLDDLDRRTRALYGAQVTDTPFVRLNVLGVQNAAALRYQVW